MASNVSVLKAPGACARHGPRTVGVLAVLVAALLFSRSLWAESGVLPSIPGLDSQSNDSGGSDNQATTDDSGDSDSQPATDDSVGTDSQPMTDENGGVAATTPPEQPVASRNDGTDNRHYAPFADQSTYSQTVNMVYDVVGLSGIAAACTATDGAACVIAVAAVLKSSNAVAEFAEEGCKFIVSKTGYRNKVDCSVTIIGPVDLVKKLSREVESGIQGISGSGQ